MTLSFRRTLTLSTAKGKGLRNLLSEPPEPAK
jgi:hypothetical protein